MLTALLILLKVKSWGAEELPNSLLTVTWIEFSVDAHLKRIRPLIPTACKTFTIWRDGTIRLYLYKPVSILLCYCIKGCRETKSKE